MTKLISDSTFQNRRENIIYSRRKQPQQRITDAKYSKAEHHEIRYNCFLQEAKLMNLTLIRRRDWLKLLHDSSNRFDKLNIHSEYKFPLSAKEATNCENSRTLR